MTTLPGCQDLMTTLSRLKTVRRGGQVQRYHTTPTIGTETVAAHSFGVATLVLALTEGSPSVSLLTAALYHDVSEQYTGDLPAQVKWAHPEVKHAVGTVSTAFEHENGLRLDLTPEEQVILKWADILDLLWFCLDQRQLGNRSMDPIFKRGQQYVKEKLNTPHAVGGTAVRGGHPVAWTIYDDLDAEYKRCLLHP